MNDNKNLSVKHAHVIAITRGVAFAVVAAIYLILGNVFSENLWGVYLGFLLTMALGTEKGKFFNYICSFGVGYLYALIFFGLKSTLSIVLSNLPTVIICEFLITFIVLFFHLAIFRETRFNVIPMIFAAVTTVFATGSIEKVPYSGLSTVIGILVAFATDLIIKRIIKKIGN
ncbi:DUF1097 domain-containing protein [Enterococcus faecalis]|nr:DUF1097 domain-containing protein [Enterococcus faecalis]